ncbi:hypothetical protein Achl_4219 (plasmid) [Pseudarthrobacter chlorophenolicus A6]|uniref:Uncharacterized protein n=1 Tax=Pseudarthrobacter chlorophenolicus (strain ATCC 700700 / DSM 12829 / CIP 107037 / JCM 12360 / KCTC 9906 / NCIMB 13794 / A6) TaxID=452863 RepID=B8HIC3_PSECP|nr:hypothetical protein [Pseudarthrobacter chlorophenolicus]ACL42170.1 hypothetical protein Achl_4219 [Pseudarthrobacter chlorophenolicus A6]SDQ14362.1 hypothetical protein SAMN04489738_0277 [Pseudarthrobacter chlorophenolicus]
MSFVATDHPRGAAGRFIPDVRAEPAITLNSQFAPSDGLDLEQATATIHARRLQAARDVLAEYPDLEIMDHSPARQHTVRLEELGDPRLALGNCWAATNEVIEQIGAAEFGADWLDEITIRRARLGGQHVAILAGDRDGSFVIDYTARQFHPDLPFPYVAGVDEWKVVVERASGTRWVADD